MTTTDGEHYFASGMAKAADAAPALGSEINDTLARARITKITPIPTSGVTRRRAKAVTRRGYLYEMDVRWAFRLGRLPLHVEAASICTCGRLSWLMPGATADEHEAFARDNEDHDYMHTLDEGEVSP